MDATLHAAMLKAGSAITRADGAVPTPEQPLMAKLGERMNRLGAVLSDANADLSTLRTRMFGPWPSAAMGADGARQAAESQADDLLRVLDDLISTALYIRENSAALNSAI